MPRRGIAVRHVRMQRTAGGIGVPTRPGGRRRGAASAAVSRVAAIGNGSASGERRSRPLPSRPPQAEPSARVSASRRFGEIFLCPSGLLRVVRSLAAFAASAVLFVLVPQGFTASDPARGALGTAAETGAVESPPDTAVAQESTSPHIVGPWHAGLSWFTVARAPCSNSIKTNRVRSAGDRGRAMKDWTEG